MESYPFLSLWFSALLSQVNRFNKSTDRGLLVTDKYIYKLEPKKQYKVLKRLPLDAVSTHMGAHAGMHAHIHSCTNAQTNVTNTLLNPQNYMLYLQAFHHYQQKSHYETKTNKFTLITCVVCVATVKYDSAIELRCHIFQTSTIKEPYGWICDIFL